MTLRATVVLAAAASLVLAGCGSSSGGGSSASSGGGKGALVVGVVVPLTGASAKTAEQMVNAATLAVAKVNANGGVGGRKLEIKVYDDKLTAEDAGKEAQRAVTRDHAIAIVGGQSSGEALAIREVAERAKVPFITPSATAESVTKGATFTYRIAPLLTDYANGVVDTAKALGLKKPVVLNDSGSAGLLLKNLFSAHAKEVGLTFVGDSIEYPINGTDVTAQVSTAASKKPDGVLIGGSAGSDHGLVAKTMLEQGVNVPLIGFSPILVNDAIKIAGKAYTDLPGVYSLQNLDQTKESTKSFIADYKAKFGDADLTEQPAQTFDAINVLVEALKSDGGEGGQKLVDTLNSIKPYGGVSGKSGSQIEFSKDRHDGFKGKYLVTYKMKGPKAEQVNLGG